MTDAKSWIEERRAALAHVLKHPHPDPAAEWAQAALDALNKVLELHVKGYETAGASWCLECETKWPCETVQATEGAINHE